MKKGGKRDGEGGKRWGEHVTRNAGTRGNASQRSAAESDKS